MATVTRTRADLKRQALQAYTLTEADQAGLAQAIYTQRVTARKAARNHAAQTVGAPVDDAWEPPAETLRQMADESVAHATDIAQTWHEEVEARIEQAMNAQADEDAAITRAAFDWLGGLMDWLGGHILSKSAEIGGWETGQAASMGKRDFLGEWYGSVDAANFDTSHLVVAVYPLLSSDDECSEYAGHTFPLARWEELVDRFPMHQRCPHSAEIVDLSRL